MERVTATLPTAINATLSVLAPMLTLNITFEKDVRYHGIPTYHWAGATSQLKMRSR
jgi:hypothetical protein